MKKEYKNPSTFDKCMSGQDFIKLLEEQGADMKRVNSKWVTVNGKNGSVNLPDTPNHLSKDERKEYATMLKWIGFISIVCAILVIIMVL